MSCCGARAACGASAARSRREFSHGGHHPPSTRSGVILRLRVVTHCYSGRVPLRAQRGNGNVTPQPKASKNSASSASTSFCAVLAFAAAVVLTTAPAYSAEGASGEKQGKAVGGGENSNSKELFDPTRYVGRWYEVASLKKGFASEGQEDCHCTQGIYTMKPGAGTDAYGGVQLDVSTFCVHGGPSGKISGITGAVSCAEPFALSLLPEFETSLEREEAIQEKCTLRFPAIPFIPREPYDVLRTDYDTYALVQGSKDRSFVQLYSRTPNPGEAFLAKHRAELADLGYNKDEIRDTPQDCPIVPVATLQSAMTKDSSMELTMSNTMPADVTLASMVGDAEEPAAAPTSAPAPAPLKPRAPLSPSVEVPAAPPKPPALGGGRNPFESLKDLAKLFQE